MTTPPFEVRRALPADKGAVTALSQAISKDDFIPELFDFWMTFTGREGLFVMEQHGQIMGCYCLEFPAADQAYLYAMRVHPAVQGHGIGSQLCRFQVEQARALGAKEIYLISVLGNDRAHRTVERNGFRNRGRWLIYDGLQDLPRLPLGRARRAEPADAAKVAAFRKRQITGSLDDVIASPDNCWGVITASETDWDLAETVLVMDEAGVAGLMLLTTTSEGLLIRRLQGSPEAAADLLAFALQEMTQQGLSTLSISLPMEAEPLLEPLNLRPESAFRASVFHHPNPS